MKKHIKHYINHASHLYLEQILLFSGIPFVDFEQVNTSWIDTMEICYIFAAGMGRKTGFFLFVTF